MKLCQTMCVVSDPSFFYHVVRRVNHRFYRLHDIEKSLLSVITFCWYPVSRYQKCMLIYLLILRPHISFLLSVKLSQLPFRPCDCCSDVLFYCTGVDTLTCDNRQDWVVIITIIIIMWPLPCFIINHTMIKITSGGRSFFYFNLYAMYENTVIIISQFSIFVLCRIVMLCNTVMPFEIRTVRALQWCCGI